MQVTWVVRVVCWVALLVALGGWAAGSASVAVGAAAVAVVAAVASMVFAGVGVLVGRWGRPGLQGRHAAGRRRRDDPVRVRMRQVRSAVVAGTPSVDADRRTAERRLARSWADATGAGPGVEGIPGAVVLVCLVPGRWWPVAVALGVLLVAGTVWAWVLRRRRAAWWRAYLRAVDAAYPPQG